MMALVGVSNPFFKQRLSRTSASSPPHHVPRRSLSLEAKWRVSHPLAFLRNLYLDFNFHLMHTVDWLSLHLTIIHLFNHYFLSVYSMPNIGLHTVCPRYNCCPQEVCCQFPSRQEAGGRDAGQSCRVVPREPLQAACTRYFNT